MKPESRLQTPRPGEDGDRPMVSALVRGMAILRAFRPNSPALGNQELSERTGLPKATVSRLTRTLTELGYLDHDQRTERYALGGGILALGHAAMANLNVVRLAEPMMRDFAVSSGATVAIGTREHDHMVILGVALGSALVTMRAQPGTRIPVAGTAMGRAYLSLLDLAERGGLIQQLQPHDPTAWTGEQARIDQARADIASRGFCVSAGEWQQDLNSVAAPVRCEQVIGRYVLVCGGPASRMPVDRLLYTFGPGIARIAAEIARAVGAEATG